MSSFKKGDGVFILDYPFGKPLKTKALIVGILENDFYNVKILNGLREGDIVRYKFWKLAVDNDRE